MLRRPFHRRPFHRRPFQRRPAVQARLLAEVDRRFKQDPAEGGALLDEIAAESDARGLPRQAANLRARAAHAFAIAGDADRALAQARLVLDLFARHNMPQRIPVFLDAITRRLTAQGLAAAAQTLLDEYGPPVPRPAPRPSSRLQAGASHRPRLLPVRCPDCGAPLNPKAAVWVDQTTAECEYCGSFIRAET